MGDRKPEPLGARQASSRQWSSETLQAGLHHVDLQQCKAESTENDSSMDAMRRELEAMAFQNGVFFGWWPS